MPNKLSAEVLADAVRKTPPGVWIWRLEEIDPDYINRLVSANCKRVYLKVYDDKGGLWPQVRNIAEIGSKEISVVGWGYHFDRTLQIQPDQEAAVVKEAMQMGLDGYIVDLEVEVERRSTDGEVRDLLARLRDSVGDRFLGYSSFGHPGLHQDMPWHILDEYTDLAFPQMYFEKWRGASWGRDDADRVRLALQAHRGLGLNNPILPLWGSEEDAPQPATKDQLQAYLKQYPGSSIFRLPDRGQKGCAWEIDYAPAVEDTGPAGEGSTIGSAIGSAASLVGSTLLTAGAALPSGVAAPGVRREQMTMVAMQISGGFEGDDPWANITGNFDGEGLTCGMLGKTFVDGDQQSVVRSYLDQFGAAELRLLMPQAGDEYLRLCGLSPAQGTEEIIDWTIGRTTEKVRQPYLDELRRFWKSPRMIGVQFTAALNRETVFAERNAASWGLDGSLHPFCFFFDIATQSGSLKQLTEADLDQFVQKAGGASKAAASICASCADAAAPKSNWRDANRNAARWLQLQGGANAVALRLFALAWLRSNRSRSEFIFTSMNRRGTLALGVGYINESLWDFREKLGLTAAPEDVRILPALPVFDLLNQPGPPLVAAAAGQAPAPAAGGQVMRVNASPSLNLRRTPSQTDAGNIIARLPRGFALQALDAGENGTWRRVRTDLSGSTVEGYVAAAYLTHSAIGDGAPSAGLTSVNLSATARLDRPPDAHPLADPLAPRRTAADAAGRCRELAAIISYLDVAHSVRYRATTQHTFCNIYASDYCYLADVYLPRVWWNGRALARLAQQETVTPVVDQTVDEMRANDLDGWFDQFGQRFGWTRVFEADDLQQAANAGGVSIIVAHHRVESMSGHIVAVPPETGAFRAQRSSSGHVVVPLQSQAGRVNFPYGMGRHGTQWWADGNLYKAYGFWTHA